MPTPNDQNVLNELCSSGSAKRYGNAILRRFLLYPGYRRLSLATVGRMFAKQNPLSDEQFDHPVLARPNIISLCGAKLPYGIGAK